MYRTIETSLWTDPKVKTGTPETKLVFIYLITNAHTHVSGIYYLPIRYMSYETGLAPDKLQRQIEMLCTAGLIQYDADREIVWVVHMFLHQGRGRKNDQSAAAHLASLHQTPLIEAFLQRYPHVQQYMAVKPKMTRGRIPTNLRFAVLKRDGFCCQYCGSRVPDATLEVDHILPRSHGGSDTLENLITSCQVCNNGKSDIPLDTLSQDTLSQDTLSDTPENLIPQEQEQKDLRKKKDPSQRKNPDPSQRKNPDPSAMDLGKKERVPTNTLGKRARVLPEDFIVTDSLRAWAAAHYPDVDVEEATAAMRDHEFAKAHSDWPATWRNWIRRTPHFHRNGHGHLTPAQERAKWEAAKRVALGLLEEN
jgi:5-methylcytosine-specific restriction endonuclease McrA